MVIIQLAIMVVTYLIKLVGHPSWPQDSIAKHGRKAMFSTPMASHIMGIPSHKPLEGHRDTNINHDPDVPWICCTT